MDTDLLVLLYDPSSTSYIPTTAERQQLREFNNSNTKMIPMIVGVSTSPSLLVSTQQQPNVQCDTTETNKSTTTETTKTTYILSDPHEHHPGRKRTRKMRSRQSLDLAHWEGGGVTWQEYTPYPNIGQSSQLEFLSDIDSNFL